MSESEFNFEEAAAEFNLEPLPFEGEPPSERRWPLWAELLRESFLSSDRPVPEVEHARICEEEGHQLPEEEIEQMVDTQLEKLVTTAEWGEIEISLEGTYEFDPSTAGIPNEARLTLTASAPIMKLLANVVREWAASQEQALKMMEMMMGISPEEAKHLRAEADEELRAEGALIPPLDTTEIAHAVGELLTAVGTLRVEEISQESSS